MASLFHKAPPPKVYYDRKTYSSFQKYIDDLEGSRTLYVGNLAFSTTDTQVRELFCSVGQVEKVIMGLDRLKRTRCGGGIGLLTWMLWIGMGVGGVLVAT